MLEGLLGSRRGKRPQCQFLFIISYGRSGSTLLQSLLATIPGAHIMGENQDVLAGLFQAYRNAAYAVRQEGQSPRIRAGDPWRGAHLIDPQSFNRKLARAFLQDILNVPGNACVVGFKEIRYFDHDDLEDYLDYIRMTFSPALLLFNRRRAEDVARSGWWKQHPYVRGRPADIEREVRLFDQRIDKYASEAPDSCAIVNYEDYCRDVRVLEPIFERLGAPFDYESARAVIARPLKH